MTGFRLKSEGSMGQTNLLAGRLFTPPKSSAYDRLLWSKQDSIVVDGTTGEVVFEQRGVEFPQGWSINSVNLVAQNCFIDASGTGQRENSLKELVDRVVDTITRQGLQEGYFETEQEADDFREELKYVLATQCATFDPSVWSSIGAPNRVQRASACFILGVEDTVESILDWHKEEGMILQSGAESGVNLSVIRSSVEVLGEGAPAAPGPLSFMRSADALAGSIKSRALNSSSPARMVSLNVDHPDIHDFIWCKAREDRKARAMQLAGFDMSVDGKDIFSLHYQNAHNQVRVTDDFMQAVLNDSDWALRSGRGKVVKTTKARQIFRDIAEANRECTDPGIQFDTTINKWHTTPKAGPITASGARSEYMHLDNSACNLAIINLLKYLREDGTFDTEAYRHTIELILTAQEILVGHSVYPTESIAKNAKAYRQLGLGYANLGALLMAMGLPYDSDEARAITAAVTALLTGQAYATSAKMSRRVGPFAGYRKDRDALLNILRMHRAEVSKIDAGLVSEELLSAATTAWDEAVELGELYGVRNSQVSALASDSTVGSMMDCDTLGSEPSTSLLRRNDKINGASTAVVSQTVFRALQSLGYVKGQIDEIVAYICDKTTIVGAPHLKVEHLNVFACAAGDNIIRYQGCVKMISAIQPFISGGIGMTILLPEDTTTEDIEQLHIDAWKMGIKAISLYRHNYKTVQPSPVLERGLEDRKDESSNLPLENRAAGVSATVDRIAVTSAVERPLPRRRKSITWKFQIADLKGYMTVGEYEDGAPGELFINISKQGSTLGGLMDALSMSISHGLQYGVPLKTFVRAMMSTSFAPSGITDDPEIRMADSITDYIARRLAIDYLSFDDRLELGLASIDDMPQNQTSLLDGTDYKSDTLVDSTQRKTSKTEGSRLAGPASTPGPDALAAPLCYNCGNQTRPAGDFYVCKSCGSTTGRS